MCNGEKLQTEVQLKYKITVTATVFNNFNVNNQSRAQHCCSVTEIFSITLHSVVLIHMSVKSNMLNENMHWSVYYSSYIYTDSFINPLAYLLLLSNVHMTATSTSEKQPLYLTHTAPAMYY